MRSVYIEAVWNASVFITDMIDILLLKFAIVEGRIRYMPYLGVYLHIYIQRMLIYIHQNLNIQHK